MNKLIVCSDVHAHPFKAFGGGVGRHNKRFQQTLKVLRDTLVEASKENAIWVCSGDLVHTTGYAKHEVSSEVLKVFEEFNDIPKVMVHGNHDSRGRGGKIEIEDTFQHVLSKALDNIHVLNYESVNLRGLTFYGIGAQPDLDLYEHQSADVGIFHDFVKGAKLPSGVTLSTGIDKDVLLANYTLSIVGDIHSPHLHSENGRHILIPGSLEQHNFGDSGGHGYYLVTIDDEHVDIKGIEVDSPKFITVDSVNEIKDEHNYYRVLGPVNPNEVPDNAKIVASGPDVVESRNVLSISDDINDILTKWITLNPPHDADDISVCENIGRKLVKQHDIIVPQNHKLTKVSGENFCSYSHFEYDVQNGVTLVDGISDKFTSNGSGKTTVTGEAIFWCLFGKTTKGLGAEEVIQWGHKECSVSLTIELENGSTLEVTRRRTPQLEVEARIDGVEVSGDSNKELETKILGLLNINENLVKSLQYFSQEDVVLLSRATDASIKDTISDLAGLKGFQEAASEAGKMASELKLKVESAHTSINQIKELREQNKADLRRIKNTFEEWEEEHQTKTKQLASLVNDLEERQLELNEKNLDKLNRYAEVLLDRAKKHKSVIYEDTYTHWYRKNINNQQFKIKALEETLASAHKPKKSVDSLKTIQDNVEKALVKINDKYTKLLTKRSEITSEINNLEYTEKQIRRKLEKLKKGICSECGQPVKSSDDMENKLSAEHDTLVSECAKLKEQDLAISKQLSTLVENKTKISLKRKKVSKLIHNAEEFIGAQKELEVLKDTIENSSVSEAKIRAEQESSLYYDQRKKQLDRRVANAKKWLNTNKTKIAEELETHRKTLQNLQSKENPHQQYIVDAENKLKELTDKLEDFREKVKEQDRNQKVYKYWSNSLGKQGIQSLLMDELAAAFNSVRGKVFPVLTEGVYDAQFSTQSTTKAGELRERLSFMVFENGQEIPYSALSGGQRRRIDLGVLLTMTAAVSTTYGVSGLLGIMILDEVTSYLDESGAESLVPVLTEYADWAVPSIYVIDHKQTLKGMIDQVMTVEYKNGVSKIL